MAIMKLSFASGEASLTARRFVARETMSGLFSVEVWALSESPRVDLEAIVGRDATLDVASGVVHARTGARSWKGVVSTIQQIEGVQPSGSGPQMSTYYVTIVPRLWLLLQRRGHRIFQHLSIPDIIDRLLVEWQVVPEWRVNRALYPPLEYKVQYGESDFVFFRRLLEEAGISFFFLNDEQGASRLVLADTPQAGAPRPGLPLRYVENPNEASEQEFVQNVHITHEVRPGAHTMRDHDFRNPSFPLFGAAPPAAPPEAFYEQYHYHPGAFLIEGPKPVTNTPTADDKGYARYLQPWGHGRAERALHAARADKRHVRFNSNALDLSPGMVFSIGMHPHGDLAPAPPLLVTQTTIEASLQGEWSVSAAAVFASEPYRPAQVTARPDVTGVQSATVVGPPGQEIYTDEFGRVRVQFPWDREGKNDDNSSCWMRVSQGWAGTGFGIITIPRVGQEVLVAFLEGDPDQPIVCGRVYNATQVVPYKLPEHKTRSTWQSRSSPGGEGYNEIMFEDLKGKELVFIQAEKNLRKLVKHHEAITIGKNRQKLVKVNETEVTGLNRTEVTGANRTEITGAHRSTLTGKNEMKLVRGTETERTEGDHLLYVGNDQHLVVKKDRLELVEMDRHLRVKGHHNVRVDGTLSISAGSKQVKVGEGYALETGKDIHLKAGTALVIEAVEDLTLKGPGGFIRIDAGGVTIKGTLVKINSGGSAGSGPGASPQSPADAKEATVAEPAKPTPDDVSVTRLGQ